MFKCSECGTEYEVMPKYCDCGNDIFINVEDFIPQEVEIEDDIEIGDNIVIEKTPSRKRVKPKKFSLMAIIVFVFCIILSLLILFFIGNPKKDVQEKTETKNTEKVSIPSIDSYWDNTAIRLKTEPKEEVKVKTENPILDVMPKIVQDIIPPENNNKVSKPAVALKTKPLPSNTKTQPKKSNSKAQTNASSKTASSSTQGQTGMTFEDLTNKIRNQYYTNQSSTSSNAGTASSSQKQNSQITNNNSQPAQTKSSQSAAGTLISKTTTQIQPQAPAQTQVQTQPQVQQVKTSQLNTPQSQVQVQSQIPSVPVKSSAQLKQELASYKSKLRNTIGKKVDFTKVIGDGECSLSFKINSSGRLTSKAFVKQSSNITLNDAAFNALNTTTSFNPPPEGYKGETLRLVIKFYNGNFEISLN